MRRGIISGGNEAGEDYCGRLQKLPEELLFLIFLRLPANSLIFMRYFCKVFYKVTSDPDFIKEHTENTKQFLVFQVHHRAPQDSFDAIKLELKEHSFRCLRTSLLEGLPSFFNRGSFALRASCDGLLLLESSLFGQNDFMGILNPITRQFRPLPGGHWSSISFQLLRNFYAMGRDLSTGTYKVVQICKPSADRPLRCQVHVVGSSEWRNVLVPDGIQHINLNPVSVNGHVHWVDIGYPQGSPAVEFDVNRNGIVSLELATETFRRTGNPTNGWRICHLLEMEGSLALICSDHDTVDLWLLVDQQQQLWVRWKTITNDFVVGAVHMFDLRRYAVMVVGLSDDNMIVIKWQQKLYVYDLQQDVLTEVKPNSRQLRVRARGDTIENLCTHVETLSRF